MISNLIRTLPIFIRTCTDEYGKCSDEVANQGLQTTRDQVTFGDDSLEDACTGVVTCIWPTVEIVRRARELGANLIISHEAIFWNHGDHRDVVAGNSAFLAKIALLEEWGGVVWRCHDYIHAGVPLEEDGSMADGIFYGLADKLGWLDCRIGRDCMDYEIPEMPARDVAAYVVKRLGLSGTRVIGDLEAPVRHVRVPMHIMGHPVGDTETLNKMDAEGVDCLLCMEIIDFTVSEYVRDAAMLGRGKCIIHMGHFNGEEPGMEYMATWVPLALEAAGLDAKLIPVSFVSAG